MKGLQAMLAKHHLTQRSGPEVGPMGSLAEWRVFRMGEPGTGIAEMWFVFATQPKRIAIYGDLFIGGSRTDVASNLGYGFEWFISDLSDDYLAEKFLTKGFHHEHVIAAFKDLRDNPESYVDEDECESIGRKVAEKLDEEGDDPTFFQDQSAVYEWWTEHVCEDGDGVPGWGYDPRAFAVLAAVQQRFRELWLELQEQRRQLADQPAIDAATELQRLRAIATAAAALVTVWTYIECDVPDEWNELVQAVKSAGDLR